ncbi:MAG TPA: hypothetical protein VKH81_16595 [Candidatus Angelobacter sp.]|nr:hypothetical protein [Candidatus Angelobacter sp.]
MLEIVKILVALLGGGLAGAIANEWFRRRGGRVQKIPLIERVNRIVRPQLHGITLARITEASGDGAASQLEAITNLREYQLTLRNTSTVHLQDAEIQFEFPAEDSQAWASRPALSKTALIRIDTVPIDPWKKAFRWKIPHLPSGDSVEFTFQSVNPPSRSYEVSLYKTERVIIEKVIGEPRPNQDERKRFLKVALLSAGIAAIAGVAFDMASRSPHKITNKITDNGCELSVTSYIESARISGIGDPAPPPSAIDRFLNVGNQNCIIQSSELGLKDSVSLAPGQMIERTRFVDDEVSARVELSFGTTKDNLKKEMVRVYIEK